MEEGHWNCGGIPQWLVPFLVWSQIGRNFAWQKVGSDWNFKQVFSGGGGVIYGIK